MGAHNTEELAKSKKAKKISTIAAMSPASALGSPIKKPSTAKTKRKSLDSSENESGTAKKSKEKSSATPAKKRKQANAVPPEGATAVSSSVCLDIFGNQLNTAAEIPSSLKTSLEQDVRRPSVDAPVACSASVVNRGPMVGPPPPALHSYSLLNEENPCNELVS